MNKVYSQFRIDSVPLFTRFLLLFVKETRFTDYGPPYNCTLHCKKLFGKVYITKQYFSKENK